MSSPTIELTRQLIARPSVTPHDGGCQEIIIEHLEKLGFQAERMRFGAVDNVWIRRGTQRPLFAFAGHTDVVPTGPLEQWHSHPFSPQIRDGFIYGRGAADMKGSLAAMLTACEAFIDNYPKHKGSIAWLITSDEEGPSVDGTVRVVETLQARGEHIDWCLVGEPSSRTQLGDVIKNGRRGSLSGELRIFGQQGHIAYPQLTDNPIHRFAPALVELAGTEWDQGNAYFPPTTFQISNLNAGTGAGNVVPGELSAHFNFRYSTAVTHEALQRRVHAILDAHTLRYALQWHLSGEPFLTSEGELIRACQQAIRAVAGITTELSTAGGTSDGRFIAPTGAQVIELGPVNASIHKINEHVRAEDLDRLAEMYYRIMALLLAGSQPPPAERVA